MGEISIYLRFGNKEISGAVSSNSSAEDSGIRIARETFGVEARQVVDPVLLFHSYPELTGKIRPSGEVITYKLINDEGFYDKARAVADTMHLPCPPLSAV